MVCGNPTHKWLVTIRSTKKSVANNQWLTEASKHGAATAGGRQTPTTAVGGKSQHPLREQDLQPQKCERNVTKRNNQWVAQANNHGATAASGRQTPTTTSDQKQQPQVGTQVGGKCKQPRNNSHKRAASANNHCGPRATATSGNTSGWQKQNKESQGWRQIPAERNSRWVNNSQQPQRENKYDSLGKQRETASG